MHEVLVHRRAALEAGLLSVLTPVAHGPGPIHGLIESAVTTNGGVLVERDRAEVLIWERHSGEGFPEFLDGAPAVRWIQLPSAGIDWLFDLDLYRPGPIWTCAKGAFGDTVADLAVAMLLAGFRSLHTFARATTWLPEDGRSLGGAHVAVLGGGGITAALLRRLPPFGVRTTVVRRQPLALEGADQVVAMEQLHEVLPLADAVVLTLPLTDRTRHVIGAAELAMMRPGAWLINVGRGPLVDTDALVDALRREVIGGAALDVADPEPLPDGHALWTMPNVIITPHVGATLELTLEPLAGRVADNLRRWRAGEPLVGLIDADAGY
jgi:phosphoglycerate dehydrogenase-like enzyme